MHGYGKEVAPRFHGTVSFRPLHLTDSDPIMPPLPRFRPNYEVPTTIPAHDNDTSSQSDSRILDSHTYVYTNTHSHTLTPGRIYSFRPPSSPVPLCFGPRPFALCRPRTHAATQNLHTLQAVVTTRSVAPCTPLRLKAGTRPKTAVKQKKSL